MSTNKLKKNTDRALINSIKKDMEKISSKTIIKILMKEIEFLIKDLHDASAEGFEFILLPLYPQIFGIYYQLMLEEENKPKKRRKNV